MGTHALLDTTEVTLVSDGDDRTSFLVSVYKKSHIPFKQDEVVGTLTDTIRGILAKCRDGGTNMLCTTVACFIDTIPSDQSARNASWRRHFRCS